MYPALYRTKLIGHKSGNLTITEPHDYAIVFLNGALVDTIFRDGGKWTIKLPETSVKDPVLEILVESMGHINFAQYMIDRKGITDRVTLNGMTLMNREIFPYKLERIFIRYMDSLTHIVLGAVVGEALAGRRLGKKAMLLGAIANSIPDIDFVAGFWLDTADDLTAHRGITHSLLFIAVLAPLMAWAARRWFSAAGMGWGRWIFFFGFELFLHILLDAFNAYGTGWFEPFSHYRVSFNTLFVADPFYSIWLAISFVVLLFLRRGHRARTFWAAFGLILSSAYLYYCILNKYRVDKWAKRELAQKHIAYKRYFTTPTPLNNWLWYIVAEDSAGFHTAYLCIFDRKFPKSFDFFPRNDSLLAPLRGQEDVRELLRFSQGYYTVEQWKDTQLRDTLGLELPGKGPTEKDTLHTASTGKDTLVFNDLRFGQMRGWENGQARFVFHYFLQRPGDNLVILQRGRFAGWDRHALEVFIRRIRGN